MVLVIGLTGNIASGKSTVGKILAAHGAVRCDADILGHRLYDPGTPGFARVVAAFGEEVVGPDGYVDRKVLSARVFGDNAARKRLSEAIGRVGPAIEAEIECWRRDLAPDAVAVMEAVALMAPGGYSRWCDQTWIVAASEDTSRQRLMDSRGLSREEADARLATMRPVERRAAGADWVYWNNGSQDELERAVLSQLSRTLELHRRGALPPSAFGAWWSDLLAKKQERERSGTR